MIALRTYSVSGSRPIVAQRITATAITLDIGQCAVDKLEISDRGKV